MNKEFDNFWSELTSILNMPQKISNWTKDNGFIGDDFRAQHKDRNSISCILDSGKVIKVPQVEFHEMYKKWGDYISGRLQRSDLRDQSHFTKYVISIIHQYLNLAEIKN